MPAIKVYYNWSRVTETKKLVQRNIADLRAKEAAELEEMRNGLFCSGCNRTKSDIVSHGETFPHSGQHVVAATPEQLRAKEEEYESKIRPMLDELRRVEEAEHKSFSLRFDLGFKVSDWTNQHHWEANAIGMIWNEDKRKLENELYKLRQAKESAERKVRAAKKADKPAAEEAARIASEQYENGKQAAQAAYNSRVADGERYVAERDSEREGLKQYINDNLKYQGNEILIWSFGRSWPIFGTVNMQGNPYAYYYW